MLAITLPPEIEGRLADLALKTGRTKTFYARKAILEYLEDLEDYYLALEVIAQNNKRISHKELKAKYGLED